MGINAARRFWQERTEYHDLAREYERNIEVTHPSFVTSNGIGHRFVHRDLWCATKVTYPEYRGPNIQNI